MAGTVPIIGGCIGKTVYYTLNYVTDQGVISRDCLDLYARWVLKLLNV